jgi:curved DNA-binding protein CbpA
VILGLRPGASPEDIRRRYRLLSRVWHPDRFTDGPPELRAEAEMMMARLNRAHNALNGQATPTSRSR